VDKLIRKTNLALVVGTHSWRDQFMEAITVSAGKRVSRWTQALLGGAGSSREAGTQTCQQLTHLRKGLSGQPSQLLPWMFVFSLGHFGRQTWG